MQTKFAKVMFLHLSVSHFVHGGLPQCMLGCHHTPRDQLPCPQSRPHPPAQCMLVDTVNKWAVCILLECDLVIYCFQTCITFR